MSHKIKTGFLFSAIVIPLVAYVLHDYLIYPVTLFLVNLLYHCGYGHFWCGAHGVKMSVVSLTSSFIISTTCIVLSRKFLHTIGSWREYILGIIYLVAILPINLVFLITAYMLPSSNPIYPNMVFLLAVNLLVFLLLLIKANRQPKISKK